MTDIKVVIGANWGDEGKGLMTDYFCNQARKQNKTCIVVCSNGGSQRGHTVETPDGIRHVFHHFGSGTFVGGSTYLSEDYIINPMVFMEEWNELKKLGYLPAVYINKNCKITTPFDMIANQILEENRGENRHGSCGLGIWETIKRTANGYGFSIEDANDRCIHKQLILFLIKNFWLKEELKDCLISENWNEIINNQDLINHYLEDLYSMLKLCTVVDSEEYLKDYDTIIFENGQGLMLDQDIKGYGEHTTPSNTGFKNPAKIIKSVFKKDFNIEICYVSRSYYTRHGAGRFDEECDMNEINSNIIDLTNKPNPHQGTIRYGKYDKKGFIDLINRCINDSFDTKLNDCISISIALTHLNEYEPNFLYDDFVKYRSYGKTRESINS